MEGRNAGNGHGPHLLTLIYHKTLAMAERALSVSFELDDVS